MTDVKCPNCGTNNVSTFVAKYDGGKHRVIECHSCRNTNEEEL